MPRDLPTRRLRRLRSASCRVVVCVLALVVVGCAAATTRIADPITELPPPSAKRIVVLHTNDNWGEVDPCG